VSAQGLGKNLKLGRSSAKQFTLGAVANDAGDRFIYNPLTGQLFFDADGTGSKTQIQFAQLSPKRSLSGKDIQIVV
jgi:Ca2+-binding RTX toxin-like protein